MAEDVSPFSHYPSRNDMSKRASRNLKEEAIRYALLATATLSIVTTFGILLSLTGETLLFFREVSIVEFLTETEWTPLFLIKKFGIWPLVTATALVAFIALAVAIPTGLLIAIYLSEFASPRVRDVVKPVLEVLAGVPTVVYGYFALTLVTPILQEFIPGLRIFNALSAGIVMGIMIIPMVASLSEDAIGAVPQALREGAYGLGATRFEVALQVVVPAALSGIVASAVLALSRAVGETMIVSIAAGQNPTFTLDPRVPIETMTAYIVQVSLGDTPFASLEYRTIFAVGAMLFFLTFAMNIFAHWFVRRFREEYD